MKKLLALTLSLLMLTACISVGALTIDLPETADEAEDAGQSAVLTESIRETVDTVAKTGDYGELIWFEDFERMAIGTGAPRLTPAYASPTYVSPYRIADTNIGDLKLDYSGVGDASVQADPADSENHVLRLRKNGQWAGIDFKIGSQILSKPGEYIVEMDVRSAYWGMTTFSISYYINGKSHTPQDLAIADGEWRHVTKTNYSTRVYTKEEASYYGGFTWNENTSTGAYTASAHNYNYPAYIHDIFCYNGQSGTQTNFWFYIDNIKIWYKEYADITFDVSGDASEALTTAMDGLFHRSFAPGEALPVPDISGSGYIFNGWKNGEGESVTTATAGIMTLYADVESIIETDTAAFSIKLGTGMQGLRFRGTVDKTSKADASEYGFLVSIADKLGDSELTFDLPSGKYLKGCAYVSGEKDLIYGETEDSVVFTAVCHGIPAGRFDTNIYARSYISFNSAAGNPFTVYGATAVQNIREQAQKYLDAYNDNPDSENGKFYAANQETLDAIIANVAA